MAAQRDISIHWFRQDLRLADNPALMLAVRHQHTLPIYILDPQQDIGSASKYWLHHSLCALNDSLGGKLSVYRGDPFDVLTALAARHNVQTIYWNRCYEPYAISRDKHIRENISVGTESTNGSLLWEPWEVKKKDGTYYKVFTPFYRKGCLQGSPPRAPRAVGAAATYIKDAHDIGIDALSLLPPIRWDKKLSPHWKIGEAAAHKSFATFLENGLAHYKDGRNLPAKPYVSRMSAHLHFGEVSPNQLWHRVRQQDNENTDHFCSELGWREFSYSQLYYNPDLQTKNLQPRFDNFAWCEDETALLAWKKGKTGIPIVDAGMRELWQTGYMHNRVRMIVGSFLVKNLRLHWHNGERWFWDTLLDADLANNSASWQWIAGCGADAAPYFRIFNPTLQAQKFDPDGDYIRRFVPEIAALPNKYLFTPWTAPTNILAEAGIELDATYPAPIVDLKQSRDAALAAFKALRGSDE